MAQTLYTTLYPRIQAVCKNVPNPLMKTALQEIARDFYLRSKAYVYTIAATDVVANTGAVAITVDTETEIVAPLEMTFEDEPLETTSLERSNYKFGRLSNTETASTPTAIFKTGATELTLAPFPDQSLTGELRGTIALRPTRDAAGIEEVFMDDHGDYIVHGVIARLSSMKGSEWYSRENLAYYTTLYENEIFEAEVRARNEHTPNTGTVVYGGI